MNKLTFAVPNIGCDGCVKAIKLELSDLAGVTSVSGDVATREIRVEFDVPATRENIVAAMNDIDYPPAS